jgi:AcrR family transcriptional regulator
VAGGTRTSSTRIRLLDVAEHRFLREGLGVSVRDITDAAGQNGAAIHYYFGSRDGLISEVIARRWSDLARRRMEALDALRSAPAPPSVREVVASLVFANVALVEADGPDAQRWLDLMHALWLARSPALDFMAKFADDERDWERLARNSLPELPEAVFAARFAFAIEMVIVGLRTPTPTPGARVVALPDELRVRAAMLVDFVVAGLEGTT